MLLCVLALGVTVGVIAPVASAHTVAVAVDCNNATFSYSNFSNDTGGNATETVTVDGVTKVSKFFQWGDPTNVIHSTAFDNQTDVVDISSFTAGGPHTVTVSITNPKGNDGYSNILPASITETLTCGTPPPSLCGYTKGFYRNHPSSTAAGVAAMPGGKIQIGTGAPSTAATAQAILNATPGHPGSVTWGSNNDFLNLVQQLITAELNIQGGTTPSAAVLAAIANANSHITLTGLDLSTSLSQTDISSLISTLDGFNEANDCP
jgi:hypothetical protein